VRGSITAAHVTKKFLIATVNFGSWHLFTVKTLPDPPDEMFSDALAQTGPINGALYNRDTETIITADPYRLLKSWVIRQIP
jgi:hypothetical protein